jgi:Na+/proline symporter
VGKADDESARDSGCFSESAILWVSVRPRPDPEDSIVTETVAHIALIATVVVFAVFGIMVARGRIFSVEDFISARRSTGAGVVSLSLIASSLGAWVLFSPAEAAARTGVVALAGYAVGSALAIAIFAWLGPRMRRLLPDGHAITEFVFHRYGRAMYAFVLLATVAYMFLYLAAEMTAIGSAVTVVTGIDRAVTVFAVMTATLVYTVYGGLRASLNTDVPQAIIIVLLLVLPGACIVYLGGFGAVASALNAKQPALLSTVSWSGWETGLALVLAIVGANLFNQGYWQRVWVTRSDADLRRAFLWAGLVNVPALLLAGSFGLLAQSAGVLSEPSAALFDLVGAIAAPVVGLIVLVLAVALVMSSVDTLLNAIVSLFAVDAARLGPGLSSARLLTISRWLTLVPAVLAGIIGLQGYSVLYLFLLADLVCVAAVVPTFYGLYESHLSGRTAIAAAVLGLVAGGYFFPNPTFESGNLLLSFAVAAVVPAVICFVFGRSGEAFAFESLRHRVRVLGS